MSSYVLAGIGEVLWDVLPQAEVLGGAPVNFAYHATALGAVGVAISTIGRDQRGNRALEELSRHGVNTATIAAIDRYATGYVQATIDDKGMASYVFPDDVAWDHLHINDAARKKAATLDALCFGTLAQRSPVAHHAISSYFHALPATTLKVFDINLRQNFYSKEIITSSLSRADILKLNDEELPVVAHLLGLTGSSLHQLSTLLNEYTLKMAILSRGAAGSLLVSPAEQSDHPGMTTQLVDTIGAGDAFTAAATLGFLQGLSLSAINERANRLAAYVCSQQGGMPTIPKELRML